MKTSFYLSLLLFIISFNLFANLNKSETRNTVSPSQAFDSLLRNNNSYQTLNSRISKIESMSKPKLGAKKSIDFMTYFENVLAIIIKFLPFGGLLFYAFSYYTSQFDQTQKLTKLWNDLAKTREMLIYEFPAIANMEYVIIPVDAILKRNEELKKEGKELITVQISNLLNVLELMAIGASKRGIESNLIKDTFRNNIIQYTCCLSDYIKYIDNKGKENHPIFKEIGKDAHYPYLTKILKTWGVDFYNLPPSPQQDIA